MYTSLKIRRFQPKNIAYLNAVSKTLNDGPEVWPLLGDRVPALTHEPVDRAWTVVWRLQPAPVCDELHHLLVTSARVRHVP
jgi:hypothetical protein